MTVFDILREKLEESERYSCGPQYSKGIEDAVRITDEIEQQYNDGWIPVSEDYPENDDYILLSFENFPIPQIGRYEENEDGGAFFAGDDDTSLVSCGVIVNAWRPLPVPYKEDMQQLKQTNAQKG